MRGTASLTVERAHVRVVIAAFICMFGAGLARAQDMEPRSYSASPIDTNFLIGSYQRTAAVDADLPISDVKAAIDTGILAYNRTFDLFGHTGSVAIVLPYFQGNLSRNVGSESKQITAEFVGQASNKLGGGVYRDKERYRQPRKAWLSIQVRGGRQRQLAD